MPYTRDLRIYKISIYHLPVYLAYILCLLSPTSSLAEAKKGLNLSCLSGPSMPDYQYIDNIIRPTLSSAGYQLSITQYDGKQALNLLRKNQVDGDCGRGQLFNQRLDMNLIRVDPPFRTGTVSIWGKKPPADDSTSYFKTVKIGYFNSGPHFLTLLNALGYQNPQPYNSINTMLEALTASEIDALIIYGAPMQGREQQLKSPGIRHLRHVMSFPIHVYLQQQHKALAPLLSKAISEYKAQSPYRAIQPPPLPQLKENEIVFSCALLRGSPLFEKVEQFYREAFNELGYGFTMVSLPRIREIAELSNGHVDGSCGRGNIPPFANHPQLIQIPSPVGRTALQLLTNKYTASIHSIKELSPGKKMAYVRGSVALDNQLKKNSELRIISVNSTESGLKMLAANRVDYFIETPFSLQTAFNHVIINSPIYNIPIADELIYYPYLHKRHEKLAKPLAKQIRNQLLERGETYLVD